MNGIKYSLLSHNITSNVITRLVLCRQFGIQRCSFRTLGLLTVVGACQRLFLPGVLSWCSQISPWSSGCCSRRCAQGPVQAKIRDPFHHRCTGTGSRIHCPDWRLEPRSWWSTHISRSRLCMAFRFCSCYRIFGGSSRIALKACRWIQPALRLARDVILDYWIYTSRN